MKIKLLILVAASLAFGLTNAYAAVVWKHGFAVRGVQTLSDGGFIFYAPGGTEPACFENGTWFQVSPNKNGLTDAGVKAALAVVLTAFSTGKTVTVAYDNAIGNCYVASVLINP